VSVRARLFAAVFVLLLGGRAASSAPIQRPTDLATAGVRITFDEIVLPQSTALTDQYSSLGLIFDGGLLYNPLYVNMSDDILGLDGRRLANFSPNAYVFSIQFVTPVREAVVGILGPDITSFTALLAGAPVESFQNSRPVQAQGFYGFGGIVFDEIRVDATGRFSGARALVDNVQFTVVPEPSTGATLGLGLAGLCVARRRTRLP
jgi:hypothetical protein